MLARFLIRKWTHDSVREIVARGGACIARTYVCADASVALNVFS